jgi:hypothetical protein
MIMKNKNHTILFAFFLIFVILFANMQTVVSSDEIEPYMQAFEKGITWKQTEYLKKTTLVQFDKDSYVDDFAYLASVPANIFNSGDTVFSNPLLFFQPDGSYPNEDKYLFLNDYDGIHYFMQDWMEYSGGMLDQFTLINVDKNELESSWTARKYNTIESQDPFEIAQKIALNEWSYSNQAVISVIEKEFNNQRTNISEGVIKGKVSGNVGKEKFTVPRSDGVSPEFKHFTVEDSYKYIEADLWFPAITMKSKIMELIPGFPPIITLPSVDPDLQLYCQYDNDWLQTSASSDMTITKGPHEECLSYVLKPGTWRVGVTNMPTEGGDDESFNHYLLPGRSDGKFLVYGDTFDALLNVLGRPITEYNCEITKYPGVTLDIPEKPPFGCKDASFNLTWENDDISLGLSLIGPCGEEIESVQVKDRSYQNIHLRRMGECFDNNKYSVIVYSLDDVNNPVDFSVSYSWGQNISKESADSLTSASEGAILASVLNCPLIFIEPHQFSEKTKQSLLRLGVEDVYVMDLGSHLKNNVFSDLKDIFDIKEHVTDHKSCYASIMEKTGEHDVIFSTIDPWSYWHYTTKAREIKPAGEFKKAFYLGPATYAAAHHGSPLLLVENHPRLSAGVMWHNEFWNDNGNGYTSLPVAPMVLTGRTVYDFLDEYGFDQEGNETILTVGGQYDMAPSWTRMFAGVATPGTIIGTPVDAAQIINRNMFYPALIFSNPALQGEVALENGSKSVRKQPTTPPLRPLQGIFTRLFNQPLGSNLKIIKPSAVEEFRYPVLHTYGCYGYRFNERASKYWGTKYQTRLGTIPGESISYQEIDQGTRMIHEGVAGAYQPDISATDITPFYASKAGYENCYSTNFEVTMDNLNQGVISWYMVLHGDSANGGQLSWYDPASVADVTGSRLLQAALGIPLGLYPLVETNPWRGYDQLWGSTEEPDTATLNAEIGLVLGWLGLANPDGPLNGGLLKTGLDLVPANIPILQNNRNDYFDGLVGPYSITAMITKFHYEHHGKKYDELLNNLHSMSFHADSCLIACKFLHISFIRHGSVMQELDPWPTSYWGGVAFQEAPRDFALGKSIGQSYAEGRTKIGIKYLFEDDEPVDWWWDSAENVVLFSDPKLHIWIPQADYDLDAKNHWEFDDVRPLEFDEDLSFDGHMPFGVTDHSNVREIPLLNLQQIIVIVALVLIISLLVIVMVFKKGLLLNNKKK